GGVPGDDPARLPRPCAARRGRGADAGDREPDDQRLRRGLGRLRAPPRRARRAAAAEARAAEAQAEAGGAGEARPKRARAARGRDRRPRARRRGARAQARRRLVGRRDAERPPHGARRAPVAARPLGAAVRPGAGVTDPLGLLRELVEIESPTYSPGVRAVNERVARELESLGAETALLEGDHLRAELPGEGAPLLVVGHADTVWPVGTLETMPFRVA